MRPPSTPPPMLVPSVAPPPPPSASSPFGAQTYVLRFVEVAQSEHLDLLKIQRAFLPVVIFLERDCMTITTTWTRGQVKRALNKVVRKRFSIYGGSNPFASP